MTEVRYSVYRDDPDDPEGNGCVNERAVGFAGYSTLDAAKARADHAAQGEYPRTWLYVRDASGATVYGCRGTFSWTAGVWAPR